MLPRIIIYDVPKDLPKEEVTKDLVGRNDCISVLKKPEMRLKTVPW